MNQHKSRTDHSSQHPISANNTLSSVAQELQELQQIARPTTNDSDEWCAYWKAQHQPWRIKPEIGVERQEYLMNCHRITPDIKKGIYPFKNEKLTRADIEWLLATHEGGKGPVDWNDENQRTRKGLDLRGADVCEVDLSCLPLTCLQGGLEFMQRIIANEEQRSAAVLFMKKADLWRAHLEGAHLEEAHLEEARLEGAQLEGANLRGAKLEGADLSFTVLKGANLRGALLKGTDVEGVILADEKHIGPQVADVHWSNINFAVIDWSQITILGDENEARKEKISDDEVKGRKRRLDDYRSAVRANRQLAVALQAQGLNEDAARFAYRAQLLQKEVFRRLVYLSDRNLGQRIRDFGSYIFSLFLDVLAGYGYHPAKTLLWYLLVIGGFATAYALLGHLPPVPDALVFSVMSFHGRGFFPSIAHETNLHNPLVVLAAAEAVIGLFIEISFIATFTQRFFGK